MFRVNGKPAIGIGVNMRAGGNNLTFGKGLHEAAERLMQRFPIGIELNLVSDQPEVVKRGHRRVHQGALRGDRHRARGELPQPRRSGPGSSSPCPSRSCSPSSSWPWRRMDISLQRISLGALIIALGLLVDDAMITIEMMISKIEEGMEKIKAATFAYTSTAFPMLTGTLITIFGFLPIGFADNNTGQYMLLAVRRHRRGARRLLVRGRHLRAGDRARHAALAHEGASTQPSRAASCALSAACSASACGIRWLTIAASLVAFGASVYGMGFVQQQFFPASNRPELLVTMTLPKNASIAATEAQTERLEKALAERSRHRPLLLLCRRRRHPLLPAARRAARQRLHGGDRGRRQGPRSARPGAGEAGDAVRRQTSPT